jgi:hypothetical protein
MHCFSSFRQMGQCADKESFFITRFPTVYCYEYRRVSELLLRLHFVLDVGRDVDKVLFRNPLSVSDEDLVGDGGDGIGGVVPTAVDVNQALTSVLVLAPILEAAPHDVVTGPGAGVVDGGARQLRGQGAEEKIAVSCSCRNLMIRALSAHLSRISIYFGTVRTHTTQKIYIVVV